MPELCWIVFAFQRKAGPHHKPQSTSEPEYENQPSLFAGNEASVHLTHFCRFANQSRRLGSIAKALSTSSRLKPVLAPFKL